MVKTSLWHQRFGHPSNTITTTLLTQSQILFTSDPTKSANLQKVARAAAATSLSLDEVAAKAQRASEMVLISC